VRLADISGITVVTMKVPDAKQYNVVQSAYQAVGPYVYGTFLIVQGDLENQWSSQPFIVSGRDADGKEIVYGSVPRAQDMILWKLRSLTEFAERSQHMLHEAGITVPRDGFLGDIDSPVAKRVLDDQERLFEDVLLSTGLRVRTLSEMLPKAFSEAKVPVYDYEGVRRDSIALPEIGNLLAHNRYVCIQDEYITNLFSDRKTLVKNADLPREWVGWDRGGWKVSFREYIDEVGRVVRGLTVRDLLAYLREGLDELSAYSDVNKMVTLHQNLHTFGRVITTPLVAVENGPVKAILDRFVSELAAEMYPSGPPEPETALTFNVVHGNPTFRWVGELDERQIEVAITVNGAQQTLRIGINEFIEYVEDVYQDRTLLDPTRLSDGAPLLGTA